MSTDKHFNLIAVLAAIAAFVLTVLFMNGEALGLQRVLTERERGLYTELDLDGNWNADSATVITLTGSGAVIEGNGAYLQDGNVILYAGGDYVLEGTLTDGSVIVNETSKTKGIVRILLNGVNIHCEDSAAIRIEEATKVILTLAEGTENTLSDGSTYSEEAVSSNIRGALFSRDDLTVNGSGSLAVTGSYRHGIVCNDDLRITGGMITVTAAEDAVHVNESARFTDMTLELTAGDDGITVLDDTSNGELLVSSGTIRIPACTEGLESERITIDGGMINISFANDGINAAGAAPELVINGGTVFLISEDGRDVDGLDSNRDIVINGGLVLISVPADGTNNAIDFGSEAGGQCYINGGTVVAAGGSGLAEAMSAVSAQASLMYYPEEKQAAGTTVLLQDKDGSILLDTEVPCAFSLLVLSEPSMRTGGSYILTVGEDVTEFDMEQTTVTLGEATGGFGGFGPGGNRPEGFESGSFEPGSFEPGSFDPAGEPPESFEPGDMENGAADTANAGPPQWNGERPDFGGGFPEMPPDAGFGRPGDLPGNETAAANYAGKEAWLITGISFAILLLGILIMAKAKNRKNIT